MRAVFVRPEHVVQLDDGYAQVPTASTLRAIRRPAERAEAIRRVRKSLIDQLANVEAAMDDTAIELHDRHAVQWKTIGRHLGLALHTVFQRAKRRREVLASRHAAEAEGRDAA